MAKEKQAKRWMAMALAAAVATSAMPVTAFAEGVDGEGGTTVTNNADGSTTEVSEKTEGDTTTRTEKTTDAEGNVTNYKTTETTTTTDDKKNITVDIEIKESTGAAAEQAAADAEDNGAENEGSDEVTEPEDGDNTEGEGGEGTEPTPEEQGQEFGENFESSEIETSSSTSTSGEETTNSSNTTDEQGRPVSSSGSTEGWQEVTETESSHEKYEQEISNTANPDGTKTWKEVGDKYFVTVDGVENEVSKEEYDAAAEGSRRMEEGTSVKYYVKDANGEYQKVTKEEYDDANYGFITESENEDTESDITAPEVDSSAAGLEVNMNPGDTDETGTSYDAVVSAMQTALTKQIVKDLKDEHGEGAVSYDSETGKCTVTVPAQEGDTHTTTIEMVLRPVMTDGKVTGFETVKTVIRTPLNGVVTEGPVVEGESSEDVSFGPLTETTTTEKFVKLPEKPDTTEKVDEATGHKTVYEVTPKYDEDGEQVGWIKTSVIYDKDGKEIGGGSETVMGEITYKSVTKQVDKTTTVTTTGQQTVETEKVIEKEVTTSTVTISADQREYWTKLWAKMSEVEGTGNHGKVELTNSMVAGNPVSHYVQTDANGNVLVGEDGKPITATLETMQKDGNYFKIVNNNGTYGEKQSGRTIMNVLDLLYGRQYWDLAEERKYEAYPRPEFNKNGVDEGFLRFEGYGIWSQFRIEDASGEDHNARLYELFLEDGDDSKPNEAFYAYCAELGRALNRGAEYTIENIDSPSWYKFNKPDAKENLEAIVTNGYWAADEGQGSLDAVKELMRANGVDENTINKMTPGIAMAATQAAIWHYGNGTSTKWIKYNSNYDLYDIISFEVTKDMPETGTGDLNYAGENLNLTDDRNKTANALFKLLINIYDDENNKYGDAVKGYTAPAEATDIFTEKDVTGTGIIVNSEVADLLDTDGDGTGDTKGYNTDVSFTLAITPDFDDSDGKKDSYKVTIMYDGEKQEYDLETQVSKDGDKYTIPNIVLPDGTNINLNISGVQNLNNSVYLYTSELEPTNNTHSQTFVGIAGGERQVSLDMNLKFEVTEPEVKDPVAKKSKYNKSVKEAKTAKMEAEETTVVALMEVTKEVTTVTSSEWSSEFQEVWTYNDGGNGGGKDPETPKDPEDPKDPGDPGDPEHFEDIGDNDVPLAGADPEEELADIADEDVPLVAAEDEIIAATGDSNHMAAGFGGMFAALAGMFMLRRKKED